MEWMLGALIALGALVAWAWFRQRDLDDPIARPRRTDDPHRASTFSIFFWGD